MRHDPLNAFAIQAQSGSRLPQKSAPSYSIRMAGWKPNFGQIAEDWIEDICASTFLADFTIRNPMYQKLGGQTKEAADLLVVFGGTLLVLQVKTKLVNDTDSVLSDIDLTRAATAVEKAMEQFRAMLEAAGDPAFFTFINARGHPLKADKTDIKSVVALVVYGLVTPDGQFSKTKLRFTPSCFPKNGIPIHLFTMAEFRLLTTLADTFPDFLVYLDVRAFLHEQNLIHPTTLPEDVWALATFEPKQLLHAMQTKVGLSIDGIHQRHLKTMHGWEEAEIPSYFIDWLIEKLYAGIDSPAEVNQELITKTRMLAPPGSLEAYQRIIPKLAMLRRRDRTELAVGFAQKIECARADGLGFRVLKFDKHEEAFLVLAIDCPRKERQAVLFNLARAAAYKVSVRHVVGIATAPVHLASADCDVVIVDADGVKVDQRLVDAVNYYFGEPQEVMRPSTTQPIT
jgi:hypothetical protein